MKVHPRDSQHIRLTRALYTQQDYYFQSTFAAADCVTTRLLAGTRQYRRYSHRRYSHRGTAKVLLNGVPITKPCQVGHQGTTFSGTTKLPSQHTSSWWYPMGTSTWVAHGFLTRDMGTTKLGLELLRGSFDSNLAVNLTLSSWDKTMENGKQARGSSTSVERN